MKKINRNLCRENDAKNTDRNLTMKFENYNNIYIIIKNQKYEK